MRIACEDTGGRRLSTLGSPRNNMDDGLGHILFSSLPGGSRALKSETGQADKLEELPPITEQSGDLMTPRTRYNKRQRSLEGDALKIVNQVNMSSFRRQFQAQKGLVDITTFISMMQRALNSNRTKGGAAAASKGAKDAFLDINSGDMIGRLIELFREIDLDGDGQIVWDEFTRFIVDKAMRFTGLGVGVNEALKEYQHNHNIDPLTRYRHKGLLDKLVAIPRRGYVAAIEQRSPVVTLYDGKTGSVVYSLNSSAPPVTMTYVEPLHCLVTANSDTTLVTWNLDDGPLRTRWQMRHKWPTPSTQMSMTYVPSKRLLYSGALTGAIYAWDMEGTEEMEQRACLRGHHDIVFDLLSIDHLDLVASASLDTTVCLWDAYLGTQRQRLVGHKKGVFSLAYSTQFRLLFSAGFEHEALVWSPFTTSPVYKLKGHAASMVGVVAVEDRPQVITADVTGVLKLWDLRNYRCVQTFSTEHTSGDVDDLHGMTCMVHTMVDHTQPRLVVATKRINFLDQLRVKTDPYTDDLPVSCALYNDMCLTIVTAAGRNIKIWDALQGNVKSAFLEVAEADITSMCLDRRKRKIIVGDSQGAVHVYNHQTGALMKSFIKREWPTNGPPAPGVAELACVPNTTHVLVGYTDSAILLYDEGAMQACPCLMEFDEQQRNQGDLAGMSLSRAPNSVHLASASGRSGDPIKLWNHATAKCEASLTMQSPSLYAVLSLIFLDPLPLLAVCCSDGVLRLWATWGVRLGKRVCLLEIPNVQPPAFAHVTTAPNADRFPLWRDPAAPPLDDAVGRSGSGVSPRLSYVPSSAQGLKSSMANASSDLPDLRMSPSCYKYFKQKRAANALSVGDPSPTPVICVAWDCRASALYGGDEKGQIRRWDLRPFLHELAQARLLHKGMFVAEQQGERWCTGSLSDLEPSAAAEYLCTLLRRGRELAPLQWTVEAHEDAVLTLEVTREPRALLSASSDQCARMWLPDGCCVGTLIQGLPLDTRSPAWDLPLDVSARQSQESAEVARVAQGLAERQQNRERRKQAIYVPEGQQRGGSGGSTRHSRRTTQSGGGQGRGVIPMVAGSGSGIPQMLAIAGGDASQGRAGVALSPLASPRSASISVASPRRRTSTTAVNIPQQRDKHAMVMRLLDEVRGYGPSKQAPRARTTIVPPPVDPNAQTQTLGTDTGVLNMPTPRDEEAALLSSSKGPGSMSPTNGPVDDPRVTKSLKRGASFIPSLHTAPKLGVFASFNERDGGVMLKGDQAPPASANVPVLASTFKKLASVSSIVPPSPRQDLEGEAGDRAAQRQRAREQGG